MKGPEVSTGERYLCIMPTFRCTAECTHCGTSSSPRNETWLPVELMHDAIDQAAAASYKGIIFTGGEPTLAGEKLFESMRRAALFGLAIRIVTNAHWASTDNSAEFWIDRLVGAGLCEINLSTGDQHARFVPIENVFRAARAAVAAGLDVVIMVETVKVREVTRRSIESNPAFKRIATDFPHAAIAIVESAWSPLSPSRIQEYPDEVAVNHSNLDKSVGCDSIFSSPTIQSDGTISPCCGLGIRFVPGLKIGSISEMTLLEAERLAEADSLKRRIRDEGPERILAWAASLDPSIKWENMYAHRCQACIRLYKDPTVQKVIDEHGTEGFVEIDGTSGTPGRPLPSSTAGSNG